MITWVNLTNFLLVFFFKLLNAVHDCRRSGSSINQAIHYGQLVRFKYFGDFIPNMNYSSSDVPNDFPLSKITAKISLHYSKIDASTSEKDMNLLKTKVPSIFHTQVLSDINHVEFAFGNKTATYVFPNILSAWNEDLELDEDTRDSV